MLISYLSINRKKLVYRIRKECYFQELYFSQNLGEAVALSDIIYMQICMVSHLGLASGSDIPL